MHDVIDLTLSDDDGDSFENPVTSSTISFFEFKLLIIKGSGKTKPALKIETSSLTNDLSFIKTEPCDISMLDSSSSESLPTPNHLLEYLLKRQGPLKV
jgi:hypothetical protein